MKIVFLNNILSAKITYFTLDFTCINVVLLYLFTLFQSSEHWPNPLKVYPHRIPPRSHNTNVRPPPLLPPNKMAYYIWRAGSIPDIKAPNSKTFISHEAGGTANVYSADVIEFLLAMNCALGSWIRTSESVFLTFLFYERLNTSLTQLSESLRDIRIPAILLSAIFKLQ